MSRRARVASAAVALAAFALAGCGGGSPGRQIVISLRGDLTTMLAPPDLPALLKLEQRLAKLPGVRAVAGPGTYVQHSASLVNSKIEQQLAALPAGSPRTKRHQLEDLLVRYGYTGLPSVGNASFAAELVLGSGTQPKPGLASLFPDAQHALMRVSPRSGLAASSVKALGNEVEQLVQATALVGVESAVTRQ